MAFADQIALIPYAPNSENATGVLAPIVRAMGHVLYALGSMADESYTLTSEEAHYELAHAQSHLARTLEAVHSAPLSTTGKDQILAIVQAICDANAEWDIWEADDRIPNLKALANRVAAVAAFLDWECLGVRDSDPGTSL